MKKIPLTRGYFTIVDDADYQWLNQWKWHTSRQPRICYAVRDIGKKANKAVFVYMHRLILGLGAGDPLCVDHIDINGLNNQRSNLRICNASQNAQNQRPLRGITSKYKGVCWDKERGKWKAQILHKSKEIHIGRFYNEIEAANAYNQAALEYFGDFARLNEF